MSWRVGPKRTFARLLVVLLALLASSTPAAAGGPAAPGCVEQARGFVPASLCLQLPVADETALTKRLGELDRAGIRLALMPTGAGPLYIEAGIGSTDRAVISAARERDIRALEADFARRFEPAPSIYVFAIPGTFELGLIILFRMTPTVARSLANGHAGALDVGSVSVALDWQLVRFQRPLTIIRHELTHAMVHQIVGRDVELPAWLDEGLAAMSRDGLVGSEDPGADHAVAAALLASSRVSLARLSTTESWIRQSAALGSRSYSVARTATELLTKDVGRSGIVGLLERMGQGEDFATAFFAVTGGSPDAFETAFPDRVASTAPAARIAIDARTRVDGNVGWSARGFPPSKAATVTIDGAAYHLAYPVAIDQFGMFSAAFGSTSAAGSYTVTVTSGATSAGISFWSGGAAGESNAHVRPWGVIAR